MKLYFFDLLIVLLIYDEMQKQYSISILGVITAERVLARYLKEKKVEEESSSFKISTGGRKMNINVGMVPDVKEVSADTLFNIKKTLGKRADI